MRHLDSIKSPADLKGLSEADLKILAIEIRQFLLESLSRTGGHLSSNLGIVELTIALHKIFDSPEDKIIFDVGHQGYVHKLLTGRMDQFPTLRQLDGMSGFLKRSESEHDAFEAGHSSTSLSAALGFAKARSLKGTKEHVIAVIGDGALTGGMAFEALNHIGHDREKVIIILNDNEMSISENVGGLSKYLDRIRTSNNYYKLKGETEFILSKVPGVGGAMARGLKRLKGSIKYFFVPGMLFEDLGITYIGPVDGHDLPALIHSLDRAKEANDGPILIHVLTRKGKGFMPAELDPDKYHGVGKFSLSKGVTELPAAKTLSQTFGDKLTALAGEDERIIALTAAMCDGTGLEGFRARYPKRFFDVGIAEQHAVTLSASLACAGMKPVFAVYSTFLQRAYDQVLHDVCIQNANVTLAIDRAGLVGQDGETHHGMFDLSFLQPLPNMTIYSPKDAPELEATLSHIMRREAGPVAIRYPRGVAVTLLPFEGAPDAPQLERCEGDDFALIAVGNVFANGLEAYERLSALGFRGRLINPRILKPLPVDALTEAIGDTTAIFTLEDNVLTGGFGERITLALDPQRCNVVNFAVPDHFVEHGTIQQLHERLGLSGKRVAQRIQQSLVTRNMKSHSASNSRAPETAANGVDYE
ncbi:1-deoxy-D-xylulose-5-phosphate synthase [Acidaminobacter hydrogenoformans]|uniref:1-deoxy-D-xylulose-5-phosphate synthase n=1 Tax=Acidaminobacter hydrogenoformans DSM 2784 TaxID=1120920 RepID=A0A1G5S6N7_9FIRM|nr:1-deoxy-D-xylulose-5-phosphate synthase [Acidaminobacter hydrogenoformans]SCZ82035.1 1-deoxy-D-xylulose-5-phosphate synthase [Acidaminobacter hydrogenoformans DSM 2784]